MGQGQPDKLPDKNPDKNTDREEWAVENQLLELPAARIVLICPLSISATNSSNDKLAARFCTALITSAERWACAKVPTSIALFFVSRMLAGLLAAKVASSRAPSKSCARARKSLSPTRMLMASGFVCTARAKRNASRRISLAPARSPSARLTRPK